MYKLLFPLLLIAIIEFVPIVSFVQSNVLDQYNNSVSQLQTFYQNPTQAVSLLDGTKQDNSLVKF